METKHTKGEWEVSFGLQIIDKKLGIRIATIESLEEIFIDHKTESIANAKLIAAAPDLLEALQAVLKVYGLKTKEGTVGREAITLAKKAIKKATE